MILKAIILGCNDIESNNIILTWIFQSGLPKKLLYLEFRHCNKTITQITYWHLAFGLFHLQLNKRSKEDSNNIPENL